MKCHTCGFDLTQGDPPSKGKGFVCSRCRDTAPLVSMQMSRAFYYRELYGTKWKEKMKEADEGA